MQIATLNPFRGYANAIRDHLDDAVAVLDAFHVVKLGLQAKDETRRRVQQTQLAHHGRKHDPIYARIEACLQASDPGLEVTIA